MTQVQSVEPAAPIKRKDGRGKHLHQARRRTAPPQIGLRYAPYGRTATSVLPWSVYGYPGVLRWLHEQCAGRASIHSIRDWIRGKRRAPPWAWALLAAALDKRIAEMTHWRDIAKKEAGL